MTSDSGSQTDSAGLAYALGEEQARVQQANERRAARRGYLVFATDPALAPDEAGYREVFATEARTPSEAAAKIRPLAPERRLRTFLATGRYRDELVEARWVASS